jgi:hypothetical protein
MHRQMLVSGAALIEILCGVVGRRSENLYIAEHEAPVLAGCGFPWVLAADGNPIRTSLRRLHRGSGGRKCARSCTV